MKSTRKVVRFDYSKFESEEHVSDHDALERYEFWGFHPKSGRLHIDTKRYKKACESVGITDFLPSGLFEQRKTVYYEPTKIKRCDYKVNIFRDLLAKLKQDWEQEYKPLLNKVMTPKEVEDSYRLDALSYTSSADDYDEICMDAQMAGFKRGPTYRRVIQSLYCQFIQKIATEVDRFTLIFMVECGWKGTDFTLDNFRSFSDGLLKQKDKVKINTLSKYHAYNLLHKLNNFLKHNSTEAYKTLKKLYPNNVATVENGETKVPYENGMFAGDWIIVKPNYIDDLLSKLVTFFEDYCRVYLGEDVDKSRWDYDDYFYSAYEQMRVPERYLGL